MEKLASEAFDMLSDSLKSGKITEG
jgi:hypothetical protein